MSSKQRQITRGDVFRYMVLPGIRPRLQAFFETGFQHVAYYMAMVYMLVRLLPVGHAYTNPANMGRFGVRHVIAEAANHLTFSWRNLDQIILFFVLLVGLMIVVIQFAVIILSMAFPAVMAAMPTSLEGFFLTPEPRIDIAFMFMDLVFGIPELFGSCVATDEACLDLSMQEYNDAHAAHDDLAPTFLGGLDPSATVPFPIHEGLHQILRLYSYGLLIVAMMITIYFIFVILAETAQTGTAFGKRFNKIWAPVRIVVAFGLLIPIGSHGLNTSQYLVLYAAKFGSSFATNGWILFNNTLVDAYVADTKDLVATPALPEMGSLMQFLFTARTCAEYFIEHPDYDEPKVYLVKNPFYADNHLELNAGTSFAEILTYADGDAVVTMRFGHRDDKDYALYKGFVKPVCGELTMTLTDPRDTSLTNGSTVVGKGYWRLLRAMYFTTFASSFHAQEYAIFYGLSGDDFYKPSADQDFIKDTREVIEAEMQTIITEAIDKEASSDKWEKRKEGIDARGWAGAAIWYNSIAEMNGKLTSAILNVPIPTAYPDLLERVSRKRQSNNQNVTASERFDPGGSLSLDGFTEDEQKASRAFWEAYKFWNESGGPMSAHTKPSGNMIIDVINMFFGTKGLFDMRENTDIHPLAQISSMGRSLIDSAIQNIGLAMIGGVGGVLAAAVDQFAVGQMAGVFSSFMVTIATVMITIGWVMFYVVPFLPFIYFFFAVAGWVKGIFEAMVGAPLWALSHIRIDGDGMMGRPAEGGYALIFEIFVRPILIVFGLLAGITVFGATVQLLNEIFELVTTNMTGFNATKDSASATPIDMEFFRGPVDQFMFTIIYAVVVYLMAMSSFKLIDTIPNQILRWMGRSEKAFNEEREDVGQGLMSTSWLGGQQVSSGVGGGLGSVAQGLTQGAPKQTDAKEGK